jgi:glycosyltransferase involved in cell wall biosynthesis
MEFRRSLGIADDELVIGWIGRTNRNMQVWQTVCLCRLLVEKGFTRFKLLIVGGGDDFNLLVKTIESSGLADRSILTGWIAYDKINTYINAMDIIPLLETDPHGGSIVREAMATGRVALSVDGPSRVQSTFMAGDHAILIDSESYLENAAEAVVGLAERPERIREIGAAAVQYTRLNMSFDAVSEEFIRALQLST